MGIPNFTSFLKAANIDTSSINTFDSILIDAQSLIYSAIDSSLKENEQLLLEDINFLVFNNIINIINSLFKTNVQEDFITIIISLDGEGVPMKYPTQQKRRENNIRGRDLYKIVLFGNNSISNNVVNYLSAALKSKKHLQFLKNTPEHIRFLISGADSEGEGEHKLFHIATHYNCKNPIIVSEDNDVFIISCIHYADFDSIQIKKKKHVYYNLNDIMSNYLQYNANVLVNASFLFGNDFIPPIVYISENNPAVIHDAMYHCDDTYLPNILYTILSMISKHMIYSQVAYVDESVILEYWKNCLWILDYYKYKNFPQKFMKNILYTSFDRNMVITALLNRDYSIQTFEKAKSEYGNLITIPASEKPFQKVFSKDQLPVIERFFLNVNSNNEGYIEEINVRKMPQE